MHRCQRKAAITRLTIFVKSAENDLTGTLGLARQQPDML